MKKTAWYLKGPIRTGITCLKEVKKNQKKIDLWTDYGAAIQQFSAQKVPLAALSEKVSQASQKTIQNTREMIISI